MRRRGWLYLVLVAVAATLALPATASAKPPRSFYGVVAQGDITPLDYRNLGIAGVRSMRAMFLWDGVVQPGNRPCCNFSRFDRIVSLAAAGRVRVFPYLIGAPSQVTPDWRAQPPISGAAGEAWQDYLGKLAARYGRGGTFWKVNPTLPYTPITTWQIWNEPSSPDYWATPDPRSYAELVKLSSEALRSEDPRAKVMLAGLFAPRSKKVARMDMIKFLRTFYKVPGIKKAFDVLAIHPYASKVKKLSKVIKRTRALMKKVRDKRTPLRVTEIGWASGGPKSPFTKGPRGQAKRLKQAYGLLTRKRKAWRLHGVDWFAFKDVERGNTGQCHFCPYTGLFNVRGKPKPVWRAMRRFVG